MMRRYKMFLDEKKRRRGWDESEVKTKFGRNASIFGWHVPHISRLST
jgi:hypothetical protein